MKLREAALGLALAACGAEQKPEPSQQAVEQCVKAVRAMTEQVKELQADLKMPDPIDRAFFVMAHDRFYRDRKEEARLACRGVSNTREGMQTAMVEHDESMDALNGLTQLLH